MAEKLTLEWSYTPAGFFEAPFDYSESDYAVEIGNGRIVATLSGVAGEQTESLFREIQEKLKALFFVAQLDNNRPYQISDYTVRRTRPDGSADVTVRISAGATLRASVGCLDVRVLDAAGNVEVDTKKERIKAQNEFASLVSRYWEDPVVGLFQKSYNAAMSDPQNEFTHLYEILDALKKRFGKEGRACATVGITIDQWGRLEHLTNGIPVSQGRHRGQKIGQLRDATPAELDEARAIAKFMIRGYFDHLDNLASAGPTATGKKKL